jgi:hypothetical protein
LKNGIDRGSGCVWIDIHEWRRRNIMGDQLVFKNGLGCGDGVEMNVGARISESTLFEFRQHARTWISVRFTPVAHIKHDKIIVGCRYLDGVAYACDGVETDAQDRNVSISHLDQDGREVCASRRFPVLVA